MEKVIGFVKRFGYWIIGGAVLGTGAAFVGKKFLTKK